MIRKFGFFILGVFVLSLISVGFSPAPVLAEPIKLSYANFPPAPTFPCRWNGGKKRL